jgi:hypothetical protein
MSKMKPWFSMSIWQIEGAGGSLNGEIIKTISANFQQCKDQNLHSTQRLYDANGDSGTNIKSSRLKFSKFSDSMCLFIMCLPMPSLRRLRLPSQQIFTCVAAASRNSMMQEPIPVVMGLCPFTQSQSVRWRTTVLMYHCAKHTLIIAVLISRTSPCDHNTSFWMF